MATTKMKPTPLTDQNKVELYKELINFEHSIGIARAQSANKIRRLKRLANVEIRPLGENN